MEWKLLRTHDMLIPFVSKNPSELLYHIEGGYENPLDHDTHKVKHPKMGEFNLFLGPVATEETDGVYYQAVFTRLVEKK